MHQIQIPISEIPIYMWEIILPYNDNSGQKIDLDHHKKWDYYIIPLCGGVTIFKNEILGKWYDRENGGLLEERVILIKISCSERDMEDVVQFTLSHYNQTAILYWKIGESYIVRKAVK